MPLVFALALFGCRAQVGEFNKDVQEIEDDTGEPGLDGDNDGYTVDEDCDDSDPAVNPGATESCNQVDDDCDGEIDEGLSQDWFADTDSDGWGVGEALPACEQPDGYVLDFGDCDDTDAAISPDATEECDGTDNDCDGLVDNTIGADTWYADSDADGYGDPETTLAMCVQPDGYVDNDEDCDDSKYGVQPGRQEKCNDRDDNCDGQIDEDAKDATTWYRDSDADGFGADDDVVVDCDSPGEDYSDQPDDCDDGDSTVHPDADEVCDDGLDNNCDGYEGGCGSAGEQDVSDGYAVLTGEGGATRLGTSLAPAGDAEGDGDGFYAANSQGVIYYFNGVDPGEASAADAADAEISTAVTAYAAFELHGDADADADGTVDLIVGSAYTGGYSGAVYLFSGPLSGDYDDNDVVAEIIGGTSSQAGSSLDVYDVDDDGSDDTLIGSATGVWIFNQPNGELDLGDADYSISGSQVAPFEVGDVDGDGIIDTAARSGGTASIFLGPITADLDSSDRDVQFSGLSGYLVEVHGASDLDGDGTNDLVVGLPYANTNQGQVSVFFGPLTSDTSLSSADLDITHSSGGLAFLGQAIDGAGDADLDGYDDLLATAPYADSYRGEGYVFYGPLSSGTMDDDDADLTLTTEGTGGYGYEYLGQAAIGAGDLDGDAYDDIVIAAPYSSGYSGQVFIWLGGS